jgi:hypothetical protein
MKRHKDGIATPSGVGARAAHHDPTGAVAAAAKCKLPRWEGSNRSLADLAREKFKRGEIQAENENDAIRKICLDYVDKNGNPLKPKSIIDNIRIRNNSKYGEGKDPLS